MKPKPCHTCARLIHLQVGIRECPGESCRRCPLRNCRCTHEAPCDRGWIETEHPIPSYETALRRCPQCALATFNAGQKQVAS